MSTRASNKDKSSSAAAAAANDINDDDAMSISGDDGSVMSISSSSEDESSPHSKKRKMSKVNKKKKNKHGIKTKRGLINPMTGEEKIPKVAKMDDDEREDYKRQGSVLGYLIRSRGRPTKKSKQSSTQSQTSNVSSAAPTDAVSNKPSSKPTVSPIVIKSKSSRGKYIKQLKGSEYENAMELGLQSLATSEGDMNIAKQAIEDNYPGYWECTVKRQTLWNRWKKLKEKLEKDEENECADEEDDLACFDRSKSYMDNSSPGLTTEDDIAILQNVAQARDNCNKGMSRKEMISFLAELKGVEWKKAENHYDYLICKKVLTQLKGGGRVVASQSTTTNRTAITTTKLLRTYNTYGQGKFQCVIDLICISMIVLRYGILFN